MINYEILSQPAWDFFEGAQSDLHWERHLKDLSETSQRRYLFCDVFKTSQIHLKNDIFFVTSLTRLKCISKKMFFSVRCLEHISKKISVLRLLWCVSKISLESVCDCPNISHKNGFVRHPQNFWNIW